MSVRTNRLRRSVTATLFLGVLLPVANADAWEQATFRGKTTQSRYAYVRVGPTGLVEKAGIRWSARCQRGRLRTGTGVTFRRRHRRRFLLRDSYREQQRGGIVIAYSVRIAARRVTRQRWKGTFAASAVVRRRGRVIDRCQLGRVRWIATVRVARLVLRSEEGDFIGQGMRHEHESPGSKLSLSGSRRTIGVTIGPWTLSIDAPGQRVLRKKRYAGAIRYPLNNGRPGLELYGNYRGCGNIFGSFRIHALSRDSRGLRLLRLSFEQHCELPEKPALYGRFTFRRG